MAVVSHNDEDKGSNAALERFPEHNDRLTFVDHASKFSGLAVAQLYLLVALVTAYEVISRYVFHTPTQWVFEVVMVLCATAWMVSSGYITMHKRHIGINVLYLMASDRSKWCWTFSRCILGSWRFGCLLMTRLSGH